jgi:hypothetical protein
MSTQPRFVTTASRVAHDTSAVKTPRGVLPLRSFQRAMSTLSGERLYAAHGFRTLERLVDGTGRSPSVRRMEKPVALATFSDGPAFGNVTRRRRGGHPSSWSAVAVAYRGRPVGR